MEPDLLAERLACGTSVADLLATVADGMPLPDPEHSTSCPYCLGALDRLQHHWGLVRAATAVTVPPPVGVEERVLRRVRAFLATGWVAVGNGGLGRTSVSDAALALVAEHEAAGVPGVLHVRFSEVQAIGEGTVRVHLELGVRWRVRIPDVADQVRRAVAHRIHAVAGLIVAHVDMVVSEINATGSDRIR